MITKFKNKTISSILTVFPQQEIDFMDEMNNYNYSELKMKKLKNELMITQMKIVMRIELILKKS